MWCGSSWSPRALETSSSSSCSSFSSQPSGSSLVSATIALRKSFFSARLTIPTERDKVGQGEGKRKKRAIRKGDRIGCVIMCQHWNSRMANGWGARMDVT